MRALAFPFAEPPEEGAAVEVAPGVLWMRLPLPMKLDHVNVYAFDEGDGWAVVDTGFSSRRGKAIWEALLSGPLAGKPVRRLLVTHHHPDHIGLAGWFQAQGAELLTSRTAWLFARMLTLDVQPVPAPETLAFWRAAGMPEAMIAARAGERPFNFADVVAPLPLGFTRVSEGEVLRLGGRDWQVAFGHGHAPDHLVLFSQSDDLVIGGDQLLPGISPNLGTYATEPEADPVGDWIDSCRALALKAEERHLVLPGHKLPFTGLPLRLAQMLDNHLSALDRLAEALTTPMTAADSFSTLYGRQIGEGEYGLALVEAVSHMNHLRYAGRAARTLRDDGAWLYRQA